MVYHQYYLSIESYLSNLIQHKGNKHLSLFCKIECNGRKLEVCGISSLLPHLCEPFPFTGGLCYRFCMLVFIQAEVQNIKDLLKAVQDDVGYLRTSMLCRQQKQAVHQQALMFRVGTNWKNGDMESSNSFIGMGIVFSTSHLNRNVHAFRQHMYFSFLLIELKA